MTPAPRDTDELVALVTSLAHTVAQGEQRARSLERVIHWGALALISIMVLLSYGGMHVMREARAEALLSDVKQMGGQLLERGEAELAHLEGDARTDFAARMAAIKRDLASVEHLDPIRSISVILHDMKVAMEAMPQMAEDMHAMRIDMHSMAADMHDMNGKMGVMAHGVDSTMGRMGRNMPWSNW